MIKELKLIKKEKNKGEIIYKVEIMEEKNPKITVQFLETKDKCSLILTGYAGKFPTEKEEKEEFFKEIIERIPELRVRNVVKKYDLYV